MSYSDHPHMVKCFLSNRKDNDGSITAFFSNFMDSYMGKSKYDKQVKVKEVFYIGDPSKNRFLLKDYEDTSDQSEDVSLKNQADDQETINLLNDYISHLDLRKEKYRMRLKTLLVVFMLRSFRSKYYKLELNENYANLLRDIYNNIIKAQYTLVKKCQERTLQVIKGEKKVPQKFSNNVDELIELFMHSDIEVNPKFTMITELPDEDEVDIKGDSLEDVIINLNSDIFNIRLERVFKNDRFPKVSDRVLDKVKDTIQIYRNVWNKFVPTVNSNIICKCVGISVSAYNDYKSKVSTELIKLSNENSYEDITAYLLESNYGR